jgi:hypothetical protein
MKGLVASSVLRVLAALPLVIVLAVVPGCDGQSNRNPASPSGTPVLTALTPSQASVGDSITLTGSGFAASDNAIKIGAGYLLGVASAGGVSLTFTLPATLSPCPPGTQVCVALVLVLTPGTYQVSVVNASGTSNPLSLQVVAR